MQRSMWLALSMAALVGGCGQLECGAPTLADYRCQTLAPGSRGCTMDPGEAFGMPAGLPEDDGVAPAGCVVVLPYCHPFYPDQPAACTCVETGSPSGELRWSCPL